MRASVTGPLLVLILGGSAHSQDKPQQFAKEGEKVVIASKYKLGIYASTTAFRFKGKVYEGARIRDVMADSAADKSRLQVGDMIVEVNGKKTPTVEDLKAAIKESGGTVNLRVFDHDTGKLSDVNDVKLDSAE